jgi:SSS family solute:Na+ symporter
MNDLRANFNSVDWSVLGAYFVVLLIVGFWKRKQSTAEYVIADRNLSLIVFVATLVATWYGGILGAGEFVYNYGLVAWLTNGVPYYVFAILFALFLAPKIRAAGVSIYTIPDKMAAAYDTKTAVLAAAFAFVYATPATYVLMAGTLLKILFGWPLIDSMVVGIVFSVVYVYRGGFLSDVRVNVVQFLLMFSGFLMAAWLCVTKHGGLAYLRSPGVLPVTHLQWMGGNTIGYVVAWFFIALVTLADPGFHQRCYAARSPRVAQVGILLAVVCWFVFDSLTTTTGLFARALKPDLTDGTMAFPALAEIVMPHGLKGLFYVGMLAPIMASVVSYTFIASMTIGRDFVWRLRGDKDDSKVPHYTRIGMLATSVLSIVIASAIPSVVQQWYFFGSVLVPGILIPLLGAYAKDDRWRARPDFAFASMVLGASVSFGWYCWGWSHGGLDNPGFLWGVQPMYPGLVVAGGVYGMGLILRTKRNGTRTSNVPTKNC